MDEGHRAGQKTQEMAEKATQPLKRLTLEITRRALMLLMAATSYIKMHSTGRQTYKRMLSHGTPISLLDRNIKQTDIPILRQVVAEKSGGRAADEIVFAAEQGNADIKAMSGLKVKKGSFMSGFKSWMENFLLAHEGLPDPKMADCKAREDDRIPENIGVFLADTDLRKMAPKEMSINDFRKSIEEAFDARIEARQRAYEKTKSSGESFEQALKDEEQTVDVPEAENEEEKVDYEKAPRTSIGPVKEEAFKGKGRGAITISGKDYKKVSQALEERGLNDYAAVTVHGSGDVILYMPPEKHEEYMDIIEGEAKVKGDHLFLGKSFPTADSITCFVSAKDAQKLAEMAHEHSLPISMTRSDDGYAVTMASEDAMTKEFEAYTNEKGGDQKIREAPDKNASEERDIDSADKVAEHCRQAGINGIAFADDETVRYMIEKYGDEIPALKGLNPDSLEQVTVNRDDAEKMADFLMGSEKSAVFSPEDIRGEGERFTMAFVRASELEKTLSPEHDIEIE